MTNVADLVSCCQRHRRGIEVLGCGHKMPKSMAKFLVNQQPSSRVCIDLSVVEENIDLREIKQGKEKDDGEQKEKKLFGIH